MLPLNNSKILAQPKVKLSRRSMSMHLLSDKNSFWRNSVTYEKPCRWSLCFLVSPCYLQDAMLCQWSPSDLPRVLQIWESIFYSQVFFTLHSFLLFSRLPGTGSSTSKLAGFHADLQNIAAAWLFVWITTIRKRGILVGSI